MCFFRSGPALPVSVSVVSPFDGICWLGCFSSPPFGVSSFQETSLGISTEVSGIQWYQVLFRTQLASHFVIVPVSKLRHMFKPTVRVWGAYLQEWLQGDSNKLWAITEKKIFTTGGKPSLPVCICFQQHNFPGLGDSWWLESEIMEESVKIFLLSESNYFPVDKWPYTSSWKVKWNHRAVGQPLPPYSQLKCLPQCPIWLWLL